MACYCFLSWFVIMCPALGQETHPYQTASSIALTSSLQKNWQSKNLRMPLLDVIAQWRIGYSTPVWLDRRIPKDTELVLSESWTTLGESIAGVAEQIDADAAYIDGVVMIVPKGIATHLETAYWSLAVSKIPRSWLRIEETVLSWEEGAVANDVLQAFCERFPLIDFEPAQLEHDIWGAMSLDKTSPLVAAIGLLSNFDLQPVLRDEGISVAPIDKDVAPERVPWEYRTEIAKLGKERWQEWRGRWSDIEVRRVGEESKTRWMIVAPVSAHRELVRPLAPPPKNPIISDGSNVRYTGRYRGELQAILNSLAKQKQLQLEMPDLPQTVLRQELDLVFEQVTFDEILNRISNASGLQLRSDGIRLQVTSP
jgi:hypothetical protein